MQTSAKIEPQGASASLPAIESNIDDSIEAHQTCMLNRRNFLLGSAAATVMITMFPGTSQAKQIPAKVVRYPRKLVGSVSKLRSDRPVTIHYPDDKTHSESILIKLGTKAGGGVGSGRDIVAFNYLCTHQGGSLDGTYKAATKSLGACPFHLSTFDLTRHGILISGQAYQSLPQVLLEVEGDKIYAVGMMGLIFGRHDNLRG